MKRLLFFLGTFFIYFSTWAQAIRFTVETSAKTIGEEDELIIAFTIENVENLQGIQQPKFPEFRIVQGPMESQSSRYIFDGNKQSKSTAVTITYVLKPTHTGTLTISPVAAKDNSGNTYQTSPLQIKVVKGSLAPKRQQQASNDPFGDWDPFADDPFFGGGNGANDPFAQMQQQMQQMMQQMQQMHQGGGLGATNPANLPTVSEKELGKNVFIKVSVDKTNVRVGEQITATYKMYSRIPMQAQLSKLPSLNGFWTQDFEIPKDPKAQYETLDGITYQIFLLKKSALFPQQTGTLLLDAAEAVGVAQIADRNNPFGKAVQFKIKSTPVKINVAALPIQNRPENFGGAVGQFSISAKVDKEKLSTDESLNFTIDIAGSGNLKLIEAPKFELPNGLDIFDPLIVDTITSRTTTISGHKIFNFAIAPQIAGDYQIPSLTFSYFDSKTNSYQTLHTNPIKIQVTQGKNLPKTATEQLRKEINNIVTQDYKTSTQNSIWLYKTGYWMWYLLSLVAVIILLVIRKKNTEENNTIGKNKRANKIAYKRLKNANAYLDKKETTAFYEEVSKAIWLYLSDKLNIPLSQLSKESAVEALQQKAITNDLLHQINQITEDCAMALYAPNGGAQQMNQTYQNAAQLIGTLEDKLKK